MADKLIFQCHSMFFFSFVFQWYVQHVLSAASNGNVFQVFSLPRIHNKKYTPVGISRQCPFLHLRSTIVSNTLLYCCKQK